MVKFQRNHIPVEDECRRQPRIEVHIPAKGINLKAGILDFSLGGVYVQVDRADYFSEGQSLRLALSFPGEEPIAMVNVKVVRVEKQGIGCAFIDLDPTTQGLLARYFELFRCTLPIQ